MPGGGPPTMRNVPEIVTGALAFVVVVTGAGAPGGAGTNSRPPAPRAGAGNGSAQYSRIVDPVHTGALGTEQPNGAPGSLRQEFVASSYTLASPGWISRSWSTELNDHST